MLRKLDNLGGHLALLVLAWAVACLPNLGAPSLWDIDEGNNLECAREMWESGNWIVPTFNFRLRADKPALLYWLQMASFSLLGVNEFAGRFPSALAVLGTLLVCYGLGRRMLSPHAALIGALALAVSPGVVGAAHFANPDALLLFCVTSALALFWTEIESPGKGWLSGVGLCCGLGLLAKGPVALVLPAAAGCLFLAWAGRLRSLLDVRILGVFAIAVLVAGPWYGWVAAETKGRWAYEFWNQHNAGRFLRAMEGHSGSYFYYLLVLLPGLLPWSAFLAPALHHAWKGRGSTDGLAVKFLLCWAATFLVFFSLASTKLPNYILPAYPALALLAGRFLDAWRRGEAILPAWLERAGLGLLVLAGVGVGAALAVAGSRLDGLAAWAWIGGVLAVGAGVALWHATRQERGRAVAWVTGAGLAFVALVAGGLLLAFDAAKASKPLAGALPADLRRIDARLAASGWFQPSAVFYARREIEQKGSPAEVAAFLAGPLPSYAFLPEADLDEVLRHNPGVRVLARRRDLYRGKPVVVVTNQ
ncbi:MAG: glycosyltransferase family 39 protein [Gemmataceae bacterium]|nr:glycosyltransferase family 39 protein [Gemmataceae bacterium]